MAGDQDDAVTHLQVIEGDDIGVQGLGDGTVEGDGTALGGEHTAVCIGAWFCSRRVRPIRVMRRPWGFACEIPDVV